MAALSDLTYFIGQGTVQWAPRASAGAINGGYQDFGDVQMLEIDQSKQKIVEVEENTTGFGGTALYASVAIPIGLKMQLTQWSMENLLLGMYGTSSGAQTSGTVTNEVFTGYPDSTGYLQNMGVSSVSLKAGSSGGTALVLGTDYTLDAKFGSVKFLSGSAVVSGATQIYANYTYAANNGSVGALLSQPPEMALAFKGLNVAVPDGSGSFQAVKVGINRVRLNLSKALSLLSKKEGIIELDGAILYDSTAPAGTSPYYTVTKA